MKTKMVAFRFDNETKSKLEANARAANCSQTDKVKYLISWYYDEHFQDPKARKEKSRQWSCEVAKATSGCPPGVGDSTMDRSP